MHSQLAITRLEHAVGAARIEDLFHVANLDQHLSPHPLCNRPEPRRSIEGVDPSLANDQPNPAGAGSQVEHGSHPIGAIGVIEGSREPGAAIGAADLRPRGIDRAAGTRRLMHAGTAPELR